MCSEDAGELRGGGPHKSVAARERAADQRGGAFVGVDGAAHLSRGGLRPVSTTAWRRVNVRGEAGRRGLSHDAARGAARRGEGEGWVGEWWRGGHRSSAVARERAADQLQRAQTLVDGTALVHAAAVGQDQVAQAHVGGFGVARVDSYELPFASAVDRRAPGLGHEGHGVVDPQPRRRPAIVDGHPSCPPIGVAFGRRRSVEHDPGSELDARLGGVADGGQQLSRRRHRRDVATAGDAVAAKPRVHAGADARRPGR